MKCPSCDFENVSGAKSCSWCKKPLPPEAAATPAAEETRQAQQRPPVPAAKKPGGARRSVKPAEPRQLKYVALVGVLIAVIFNEVYARAHSASVEIYFGRGNFDAVRLLSDLMVAVFAYYNSY